jgi:Berberine and berberine like
MRISGLAPGSHVGSSTTVEKLDDVGLGAEGDLGVGDHLRPDGFDRAGFRALRHEDVYGLFAVLWRREDVADRDVRQAISVVVDVEAVDGVGMERVRGRISIEDQHGPRPIRGRLEGVEVYARAPSDKSLLVFQQVGGAIARVSSSDSAYANRDALYDCFPIAIWDDRADDDANALWVRESWSVVRPYSTGGVYANNLGEEGEDRVRDASGANYARLVALKNRYDPANFFRRNQNIRPTA